MAIGSIINAITGARASRQQVRAAESAQDEQRRQFDLTRQNLSPFIQAGTSALSQFIPYQETGEQALNALRSLIGFSGAQEQQKALYGLEQSPLFTGLVKQGEEALLQRASATGGLRGGNTQAALAQFRPAMLQQLIEQQYSRLGGLSGTGLSIAERLASLGQSSGAMQGQLGQQSAQNIGNLYGQIGQAKAGGTLAIGQSINQGLGSLAGFMGGM